MYVCMHVCMHACMHICMEMYVCMYVWELQCGALFSGGGNPGNLMEVQNLPPVSFA